ncbi:hypothetical protein EVAR_82668_1 [Eumeta japonica]|uniref:Uncharacterized protein n=1 Tax=Eumeta variegata TaxID=151549 RepID=A0A4C1VCR6_EUMVA|nr:hypothetical protein EVAR_82668_1 [Eumeta japonica]
MQLEEYVKLPVPDRVSASTADGHRYPPIRTRPSRRYGVIISYSNYKMKVQPECVAVTVSHAKSAYPICVRGVGSRSCRHRAAVIDLIHAQIQRKRAVIFVKNFNGRMRSRTTREKLVSDAHEHCNLMGFTNALSVSWIEIGYLVEEKVKLFIEREWATGTLTHLTKRSNRSCYLTFVLSGFEFKKNALSISV